MIDKEAMIRPTPGLAIAFAWLVIVLLGLPMAWFGASRAWTKLQARHWTPVSAEVVASDTYLRTGKQKDRCVRVRYAYMVAERKYESRSVGTSRMSDASCEQDGDRFQQRWGAVRAGVPIVARYDPGAPERSAIVVEQVDFMDVFLTLAGLAFIGAGAWEIRKQKR